MYEIHSVGMTYILIKIVEVEIFRASNLQVLDLIVRTLHLLLSKEPNRCLGWERRRTKFDDSKRAWNSRKQIMGYRHHNSSIVQPTAARQRHTCLDTSNHRLKIREVPFHLRCILRPEVQIQFAWSIHFWIALRRHSTQTTARRHCRGRWQSRGAGTWGRSRRWTWTFSSSLTPMAAAPKGGGRNHSSVDEALRCAEELYAIIL